MEDFKIEDGELIEYRGNDRNVVIPNCVTTIKRYAFAGCTYLESITIPYSVKSIGDCAFSCCSSLSAIVVDSQNMVYDSRNNCNAIIETATNTLIVGCKNTIIPNSVKSIGQYAFRGCSSLTSITIPNSVIYINDCAFQECKSLQSIVIPNSVKSIGDCAFSDCLSLKSITIPNSVISIGVDALPNCSSLTTIKVDFNNSKYDSRNNCNAIIETATNTLIAGCKNTIIPNSVKSIGDFAFFRCSSLKSIDIPYGVTSIGCSAFSFCTSLTSIIIPDRVKSIGQYAFRGCSSLTSITIPNSVTSIGDYAFSYCSSLSAIVVDEWNIVYDSRNNCNAIIETSSNILIAGCKNTIIPNGVEIIENRAFQGCSSLKSITIPNSVEGIRGFAFQDCSSLTSITIPKSVEIIGDDTFEGCEHLDIYFLGTRLDYNNSFIDFESLTMKGAKLHFLDEIDNYDLNK